MADTLRNDVGIGAPLRLVRPYMSTYRNSINNDLFLQQDFPRGNDWIKQSGTSNQEVFSIKVRMYKDEYTDLNTKAIPITPAMLGLAPDETARIIQDDTLWRLEPNGDNFIVAPTEAPAIAVKEKLTGQVVAGVSSGIFSRPDRSMWNSSTAIQWGGSGTTKNPTLLVELGYEIDAVTAIGGGNSEGSYIELQLFYTKLKRFDAGSK